MQKKFSEFVQEYKTWKKETMKTDTLDVNEVKEIREAYETLISKKSKLNEKKETEEEKLENAKTRYLEWKKNVKKDDRPLTLKEENKIRAKLGMKLVESSLAAEFKEFVSNYRNFKESHGKSTSLNDEEKKMLKENFIALKKNGKAKLEESKEAKPEISEEEKKFNEAVEKFAEWKKVNRKENPEVTEFEKAAIKNDLKKENIVSKLEEAKKLCREARVHIIEGDMMDAGAAVQNAGAAVQAADAGAQEFAADPNAMAGDPAATPLPQNIVDEIANIKQSVDTLAAEAGIQSPLDLGADPNAGVPATTGVGDPNAVAADPNAAQPLPESTDSIEKIKARLEEREAKLEEGKYFVDGAAAEADAVAKNKNLEKQNFNVDKSNPSEELVKIPSTSALLKGTATGPAAKEMKPADQWPTEKISDVSMEKKLGNIEESTEKTDENAETKTENLNENKEEAKVEADPVLKKVQESLDETGAFNWHNFVKSGNGF